MNNQARTQTDRLYTKYCPDITRTLDETDINLYLRMYDQIMADFHHAMIKAVKFSCEARNA